MLLPIVPHRFDQEVMSMARDLEKKDLEFEQCVIALAKVMETAQVGGGNVSPLYFLYALGKPVCSCDLI